MREEKIEKSKNDYHKVFGMLLIHLRKNNYDLEYSIMSNISDIKEKNGNIIIGISDEFGYNKLQSEIKDIVEKFFKENGYGCEIIKTIAQEKVNVLDLLKEKFGKYLKIVK